MKSRAFFSRESWTPSLRAGCIRRCLLGFVKLRDGIVFISSVCFGAPGWRLEKPPGGLTSIVYWQDYRNSPCIRVLSSPFPGLGVDTSSGGMRMFGYGMGEALSHTFLRVRIGALRPQTATSLANTRSEPARLRSHIRFLLGLTQPRGNKNESKEERDRASTAKKKGFEHFGYESQRCQWFGLRACMV